MSVPTTASKFSAQFIRLLHQHGKLFLTSDDGAFWLFNAPAPKMTKVANAVSFPNKEQTVQSRRLETQQLTLFALVKDQQIFAVSVLYPHTTTSAEILSFWVNPAFRRQGYGRFLLQQIDLLGLKRGISQWHLHYRTYFSSAPIWEKMLKQQQWTETKTLMYYLVRPADLWDKVFAAKWFEETTVPEDIQIEEATPEKLAILKQQLETEYATIKVPNSLDPLQLPDKLTSDASIIAYQNGKLVGWSLIHFLRDNIWQCTTLFLLPDYRATQMGKVLTAEMVRRFAARGTLHYLVQPNNTVMLDFVKKYYVPYGTRLERLVQMQKIQA